MPSYKLTYFGAKGRGEVVRFIFAQAGVPYDDVRLEYGGQEWPKIKEGTPFGTMPILEVDGKQLCESMVIARFLGERFGLAGDSDMERAEIACVAEATMGILADYVATFYEQDETRRAAMMKKISEESAPAKLKYFERRAVTNENGWMVGGKLSWADLAVYQMIDWMKDVRADMLDEFPGMKKLKASVEALPNIAKWIQERPKTPW